MLIGLPSSQKARGSNLSSPILCLCGSTSASPGALLGEGAGASADSSAPSYCLGLGPARTEHISAGPRRAGH